MIIMLNKVMIIGRLGRDPEMRSSQTGATVCSLHIPYRKDHGEGKWVVVRV